MRLSWIILFVLLISFVSAYNKDFVQNIVEQSHLDELDIDAANVQNGFANVELNKAKSTYGIYTVYDVSLTAKKNLRSFQYAEFFPPGVNVGGTLTRDGMVMARSFDDVFIGQTFHDKFYVIGEMEYEPVSVVYGVTWMAFDMYTSVVLILILICLWISAHWHGKTHVNHNEALVIIGLIVVPLLITPHVEIYTMQFLFTLVLSVFGVYLVWLRHHKTRK